jgi:HSP20 family protein
MRDLCATHDRLGRLFDSFFSDSWSDTASDFVSSWAPRVDVEETPDAIVLRADLPGLSKKDIQISVEDRRLTIRGERRTTQDDDKKFYHVERAYGAFSRSFQLPATVLADKVEASYNAGVLEVTVPKAEAVKPRQIEIK